MTAGNNELFDFNLSDFLGKPSNESAEEKVVDEKAPAKSVGATPSTPTDETVISYLLVNALLNLLIAKNIVYPHEVNALLSELHVEYRKNKRSDTNGN